MFCEADMDKQMKLLAGLLVVAFLMLIATDQLSSISNFKTIRLSLTQEGCSYANTVGLQVIRSSGCDVIVRFSPSGFGRGGVIRLDDTLVAVTESMFLRNFD
jgi:hypothetical protein